MNYELRNKGFSLTEVLMAIGIFSVAMIFIAGAFPVAIHFANIASEQTIAAVVADEAFAKIRLYGVNPADPNMLSGPTRPRQVPFYNVRAADIDPNEFAYPSDSAVDKQYYWSAICRKIDVNDVQVTVFVSRKIGAVAEYYVRDYTNWPKLVTVRYPAAVPVWVQFQAGDNKDEIIVRDIYTLDDIKDWTFINDGCTIVEDSTGQVYRVLQKYVDTAGTNRAQLDKVWNVNGTYPPVNNYIWVIPPPVNGGRYPCVGVFQKVIRF